ncbi:MAG: hypothetical protein ISS19_16180 [Bacteroidales bacterium]|nr:hypothetical protein [Bacteroidales bacterium]
MRIIVFILFLTFTCLAGRAQIFIGKDKVAVKQLMKEKREFALDESSVNAAYNTLKYVDNRGSLTCLFLFDDSDICTLSKLMCDYSFLEKTTKQLDEDYTPGEEGQWTHTEDGINYLIILKKGDWFFSVLTKKTE